MSDDSFDLQYRSLVTRFFALEQIQEERQSRLADRVAPIEILPEQFIARL